MRDRTISARDAAKLAAWLLACACNLGGCGLADIADSLLCHRVSDQQAACVSVGYDLSSVAGRLRAWLHASTAGERGQPESAPPHRPAAAPASRPAAPRGTDRAVAALYEAHYQSLVRLAALLVRDMPTAERIVQDSFVALLRTRRWQDTGEAVFYLREAVVHRSRSAHRRRAATGPGTPSCPPGRPGGDQRLVAAWENPAIVAALYALPARQREALVLRYYADLPEAQIAAIIGISEGAVQSYTARAVTSLRAVLESTGE